MENNRFEFADVGLYREKKWIKGTLKIERRDVNSTYLLSFMPVDNAYSRHAVDIDSLGVQQADTGESGGDQLVKIGVPIPGKNKPKIYIFNFGNRSAASETTLKSIKHRPSATAGAPTLSQGSQRPITPPIPNASSSSLGGNNGYFQKYGRSEPDLDLSTFAPGGATSAIQQARKTLLEIDDELRELYKSVVVSGVIDDEEFWAARQDIVDEESASLSQQRGLSSGLTADVHASRTDQESVRYELTKEQVQRILLDQPKVNEMYKAKVPALLSELEFWKHYLSSRFYHPNRNLGPEFRVSEQARAAARIFGNFDEEDDDDQYLAGKKVTSIENRGTRPHGVNVDPSVDLLRTLNDDPHGPTTMLAGVGMAFRSGYGIIQRDIAEEKKEKKNREKLKNLGRKATVETVKKLEAKPLEADPLLSRYNRHGALVLPDEENNDIRVRKRIQRMIEMENDAEVFHDLVASGGNTGLAPIVLDLKGTNSYMSIGGKAAPLNSNGHQRSLELPHENLSSWSFEGMTRVIPSSRTAVEVLEHVVRESNSESNDQSQSLEKIRDHEELLRVFRISNELRRHFWTTFPPPLRPREPLESQTAFTRLEQVVAKLVECKFRLRDFRDYARNDGNTAMANLLLDLIEQIEKPLSDFQRFKQLQLKKRAK